MGEIHDALARLAPGAPEEEEGARLRDLFVTLLVAFVLVFGVVRPFIVAAYWVPTESKVPTLLVGDRSL